MGADRSVAAITFSALTLAGCTVTRRIGWREPRRQSRMNYAIAGSRPGYQRDRQQGRRTVARHARSVGRRDNRTHLHFDLCRDLGKYPMIECFTEIPRCAASKMTRRDVWMFSHSVDRP